MAFMFKRRKWIPCAIRQPDESGDYLVTTHAGTVRKATYRAAPLNQGGSYWRGPVSNPLAWMPLPEPWEE